MIKHSVIFSFKAGVGESERKSFFDAANRLANIDGVDSFEIARQVSPKNEFEHGISMSFNTQQAYDSYNTHPQHSDFINEYWLRYVEDFLEIDLIP